MIVQLLQSFLQISQVIILCSNLEETALVFDWSDVIRSDLSCGFSSSDSPPPLSDRGQKMGRKDASATQLPVDQYRKQIGKQDYKKTKSVLKATRLKAEAKKKNTSGFRDAFLVVVAILFFVLCVYAFFYLNLSTEINLDSD
uniref:Triple QxxK/R motif-containing protein n=2 Tax=Oryzias latipes TaxID=8090 RepID=A0A3B3HPP8_ORYLA